MKPLRTLAVIAILAAGMLFAVRCGGMPKDKMESMHLGHGASPARTAATVAPTRTIDIDMVDLGFSPNQLHVARGSTVRLVFHNHGQLDHEAVIGDAPSQQSHEMEMADMGGMGHVHDTNAIVVPPGRTGELTYAFSRSGTVIIGCHRPGHYTAGMKATVTVT